MDNVTRRDQEMVYIADEKCSEEMMRARKLTWRLNSMDPTDIGKITAVLKELLGDFGEGAMINPPFHCDYGTHIHLGKNTFINYNCTILDVGKVTIGENCQIAPNVSLYTAGHPVHPAVRNTAYEYGIPVTVGNNVWIGGNTVVCPGVHIGDNTVIGAGSVVTKDIPAWSIAVGSPCRVIRKITEKDRDVYFAGRKIDGEAMGNMKKMWDAGKGTVRFPSADEKA